MIDQRPPHHQNESFANNRRKLLKNRNYTFPAVHHPTQKPEPAPDIPRAIADHQVQNRISKRAKSEI